MLNTLRFLLAAGCLAASVAPSTSGADGAGAPSSAGAVPQAVFTDPPMDAQHPAHSTVLHIPSHGAVINGLVYSPPGMGTHPTLVICHGLPGNEKNLDLAQAVRRAGWNTVTFNYRGSWGSGGVFRFGNTIDDAAAVLAYLRKPDVAASLGVDPRRIVLAGHSLGGWVTVHTAAHDPALLGAILISAADMGDTGSMPMNALTKLMADNKEALAGVTAHSMAVDLKAHGEALRFGTAVEGLQTMPLLVLTADDGLAPDADALVQAIKAKGGGIRISEIHVATDHSWSDRRIALESAVLSWLAALPTP